MFRRPTRRFKPRRTNRHRYDGAHTAPVRHQVVNQGWITLLHQFREWRENLDVKFKYGFYAATALLLMVGLPAGVAVLFHQSHVSRSSGYTLVSTNLVGTGTGSSKSATASSAFSTGTSVSAGGAGNASANWGASIDASKTVKVYDESSGRVIEVPLNQYIENVLAAQMSSTAPMAALQATAVAIRTYAQRAMDVPANTKNLAHEHHADVTTSGVNDLAWLTDTQQQSTFGNQYAVDKVRLQDAVGSTDGLILTYQNTPILAFMTEMTAGSTRSATGVLNPAPPYLRPVSCPADAAANNLVQHFSFSNAQLATDLNVSAKKLDVQKFTVTRRDKQGYALQVQDGGDSWQGETFAAKLGLPSSNVAFKVQGGKLDVVVKGTGSGFGMSLHQSVAFAKAGETWQHILHTFYAGAKIVPAAP